MHDKDSVMSSFSLSQENGTVATAPDLDAEGKSLQTFQVDGNDGVFEQEREAASQRFWQDIAGVAGNVLEWYDFAIFGFLGDVIGEVFFPPSSGDIATLEAFAVFGAAFLMRPVGGVLMGYIGDVYGRKKALVLSIFLMAFPTFFMGCLPSYERAGVWAIVLLVFVRLLQGLSVGGQLMSSLVFTLENHDRRKWGLYGSCVMAAANVGSLLGAIVGVVLRNGLTNDQLVSWGWRIPFLSGIIVAFAGFYLRSHHGEHDQDVPPAAAGHVNPVTQAFSRGNRRSLAAACLTPMLWAAGFYMSFVWMAIFMSDMLEVPVPHAFAINSLSLLVSVCIFFPFAGMLSDKYSRKRVMTVGGVGVALFGPLAVYLIAKGNALLAFFVQCVLGILLSLWGAPMMAWLVEAFDPAVRLTSVAIGYNIAHAIAGGSAPSIATLMVDKWGPNSPGWLLTGLALLSLLGLLVVAPPPPSQEPVFLSTLGKEEEDDHQEEDAVPLREENAVI
jgi:MHS family proline/betaine transporter-like MFS transporter